MTFTERLKKIQLAITEIMGEKPPVDPNLKLEFADKFTDDTPVIFSPDLSSGATVMMTTAAGTMPVADGEYTLVEAKKTVTVYAGKVSKIEDAKATPGIEELQQVLEQKLSAQFIPVAKLAELETKMTAQNELIAKQTLIISEMNEAMIELSKQEPTQEPVNPEKGKFNPEAIADAIAELKKSKNKNI